MYNVSLQTPFFFIYIRQNLQFYVRDKTKDPKERITLAEYYSLLGVLEAARTCRHEIDVIEQTWKRILDYKDDNCSFSEMLWDDEPVLQTLNGFIEGYDMKILNKELKCRR